MSIRSEVENAIALGKLFHLPLELGGFPKRRMYVCEAIERIAFPDWSADEEGLQHAAMRAALDKFTAGLETLSVSQKPFHKHQTTFLARVSPVQDECWAIRCLGPEGGIRVFGRFIARDVFAGLHWEYRAALDDDDDWKEAVQKTKDGWRDALGFSSPHRGGQVGDYISRPFEISET